MPKFSVLQVLCNTYQTNSLKTTCIRWSITQANMNIRIYWTLYLCLPKIFDCGSAAVMLWLCLVEVIRLVKSWRFYEEFWLCELNVLISTIKLFMRQLQCLVRARWVSLLVEWLICDFVLSVKGCVVTCLQKHLVNKL